jgi:hypothetical protein
LKEGRRSEIGIEREFGNSLAGFNRGAEKMNEL